MNRFKTVGIAVVALVGALGTFSSPAYAGPAYNCKGDKGLDSPMQFSYTVQGESVHLSAFGGSDKSPWVSPSMWRILDSSGREVDYFPRALLVGGVSRDMLRETNLEGLVPGTAYTIELTSVDFCLNSKTVTRSLTLDSAQSEPNAPQASVPTVVWTGFGGFQSPKLYFSALDDSGIREIVIYFNGTKVKEFKYYDGVSFRWWVNEYPADGVRSTLEGPYYFVPYATSYRGQFVQVEIDITDVFGNRTTTEAWLTL